MATNSDVGIQAVCVRSSVWESFAFDPLQDQSIVVFGGIAASL